MKELELATPISGPPHLYTAHALPQAISHRGLRSRAPENSIPAFRDALTAGAEAIELDVHASRDGTLYVHHDAIVASRGDDPDSPLSAIAQLDTAAMSALRLAGDVEVPTLDDVLSDLATRAFIFIEIKGRGIEADVAQCLRRHAATMDSCAVHAFDHRTVRRLLAMIPSLRTGILQVSYPIDSRAAMRAAGATDLWQHVDLVDSTLASDVSAAGGRLIAWTVNDAADWERLALLGVHGICTDRIEEYVRWKAAALVATRSNAP